MSNVVTRWLARHLRRVLVAGVAQSRQPDFIIGTDKTDPYMRRWWIIPRNKVFNVYLHEFLKDDDDRALHDHPWLSLSLALSGYMVEKYMDKGVERQRYVMAGDVIARSGTFSHRMLVVTPSWTLFITGPVYREWGFHCPTIGWRHWKEFTAPGDRGGIGKGCD